VRKDAKFALCVILALMVLVVIIWGRSPRPGEELAFEPEPASDTEAASRDASQPTETKAPDMTVIAQARRDVEDARRKAPGDPLADASSLFSAEHVMINHPPNRAVMSHSGTPEQAKRVAASEQETTTPTPKGQTPPSAAQRRTAPGKQPGPLTIHTVAKGETYERLARKYYNDRRKWRVIFEANKVPPTQLRIGLKLTIPALPGASKASDAQAPPQRPQAGKAVSPRKAATSRQTTATRTYKVKKGDTFFTIARRVYRDPAKWQKLYEHNRAKLPRPGKPACLRAGMVIDIPDLATTQ